MVVNQQFFQVVEMLHSITSVRRAFSSVDEIIETEIRGSEDKDSRLTETEPQTISIAEEDIIEDENFQTIVINGLIT